jgi:hypothetical protein
MDLALLLRIPLIKSCSSFPSKTSSVFSLVFNYPLPLEKQKVFVSQRKIDTALLPFILLFSLHGSGREGADLIP